MSLAPPVATVRVDERAKNHLINLKRRTGLTSWNVLCRWALCSSLAEASTPTQWEVGELSNVEMTWHTFPAATPTCTPRSSPPAANVTACPRTTPTS